jgi:hypothetical protein
MRNGAVGHRLLPLRSATLGLHRGDLLVFASGIDRPPVVMYCILFYLFAVGLDNRQKAVSGKRQIDLA